MCISLLAVQAKAASSWPLVRRKPSRLGSVRYILVQSFYLQLSEHHRSICVRLRALRVAIAMPVQGTLAKAVLILESGITGTIILYETLFYLVQCHLAHVPGIYIVIVL
jgi:hypothetical protein